jgi:hypothetical protein
MSQDVPGFVANALLMPYINEVSYIFSANVTFKTGIFECLYLGPQSLLLLVRWLWR